MKVTEGLVRLARSFAFEGHRGHLRKYTGAPYITHPARVARAAKWWGLSEEAIAAAWLHDVVEDCGITFEELEEKFGPRVSFLVDATSDLNREKGPGNPRAKRKAAYAAKIHAVRDYEAHMIKGLDILDNAPGIKKHDPDKFWEVYRDEARNLASKLDLADAELRNRLADVLG